jgi:hypothetical protein
MTAFRAIAFAAFAAAVIATVTGPAGSSANGACGSIVDIRDPGLRASFERFEATQSATASKICAHFRNASGS